MQRERGSAPGCPGERAPRSLCSQGRPRGPMARPRGPPGATCHPSSRRARPPPGSPSAPGWTGALGPQRVLRRCSVFTSFPLFCNPLWAYLSFAPLLSGRRESPLPFVVSWWKRGICTPAAQCLNGVTSLCVQQPEQPLPAFPAGSPCGLQGTETAGDHFCVPASHAVRVRACVHARACAVVLGKILSSNFFTA